MQSKVTQNSMQGLKMGFFSTLLFRIFFWPRIHPPANRKIRQRYSGSGGCPSTNKFATALIVLSYANPSRISQTSSFSASRQPTRTCALASDRLAIRGPLQLCLITGRVQARSASCVRRLPALRAAKSRGCTDASGLETRVGSATETATRQDPEPAL